MSTTKRITDHQIKALKPTDKIYKVADGDGLFLYVNPSGSKIFKMRYKLHGKGSTKSLGKYPTLSLKDARQKRDEFKIQIENGLRPLETKSNTTFKEISEEYLYHRSELNEKYMNDIHSILKRDFYPAIGHIELDHITPAHMIDIYKGMEKRGIKTATKKAGSLVNRIFKYAVTTQQTDNNPTANIDLTILLKKHTPKNFAHITDTKLFQELLQSIEYYEGDIYTKTALQFMPYAFVRPANIQFALWDEFDFKKKLWIIPKEKMKMKRDHIVPLTESMIKILNQVKDNGSEFVFPSPISTKRQLSNNTLNMALKRMGFKDIMTAHGFRHTASTFLHENIHIHGVQSDAIEMQLAHVEKNNVKGIYNKALYMSERTRLMEWWSSFIDELKQG